MINQRRAELNVPIPKPTPQPRPTQTPRPEERLAAKIPEEYRKEIVELQIIDKAQAVASNESMIYLATIWKNYIDASLDPKCGLCYERVLKNFRKMKPAFIALDKGDKMLDKL